MTIEERKQRILAKIAEMKSEGADMKLHAALHSCTTMNENGVQ